MNEPRARFMQVLEVSIGPVSVSIDDMDTFKRLSEAPEKEVREFVEKSTGFKYADIRDYENRDERGFRCMAKTKSGRRCRHYAIGKARLEFDEWIAARDDPGYCYFHGEGSSQA
jgi:hypothetical protein